MKGLFVFVVFGLVACGSSGPSHQASSVAAVVPVSESLQKNEDLLFRLLCAETKDADMREAARVTALKGAAQVELSFPLDQALAIGSICRLEVRALKAGTFAAGAAYEFQSEDSLFYASSKGALKRGEAPRATLDVALYKVYRDLNLDSKPVASELTFPAALEGSLNLKLLCGEKAYAATVSVTAAAPVYKGGFALPYKDLTAPLSCTKVTAVNSDASVKLESVLSPALEILKNKPATVVAALSVVVPAPAQDGGKPPTSPDGVSEKPQP